MWAVLDARWRARNGGKNLRTFQNTKAYIYMHLNGCLKSETKEGKKANGKQGKRFLAGGWKMMIYQVKCS